ncbi:MAG: PIG-L family deacetylase, partial [Cyclobacteriaceae bacterium]
MKYLLKICLLILLPTIGFSQREEPADASEILLKLERLNFLGTVLYVAAHPDDENTSLIAWLANEKKAHTAYLSMTRGDGGQNLIGPEIREGLGLIRTQELLAARRIDGGRQFFTRANDFGYSKTAEETLRIWNEEKVLSDVVRAYRKFRPDVIITRFPPDERAGHGHHTTSAILAQRAFDISGDRNSYSDQLNDLEPWSPARIFTNTGRWWNPDMDGSEEGVLTIDVGAYNPLLGTTYTEMSALSRSQHKSQGFGVTGRRGNSPEFLEFVKGEPAEEDIFEGVDTSWDRVSNGSAIGAMRDVIGNFDPLAPYKSVDAMLEIRQRISVLDDEFWKTRKLIQADEIIGDMIGLYIEARASDWQVVPGEKVDIELELIQQSPLDIRLTGISSGVTGMLSLNSELKPGGLQMIDTVLTIPGDMAFSQPYWLRKKGTMGMYSVDDKSLLGKPENDPSISFTFNLEVEGQELKYNVPLQYRWNDPVIGEKHAPLVIAPPVFVEIKEPVYLFPNND